MSNQIDTLNYSLSDVMVVWLVALEHLLNILKCVESQQAKQCPELVAQLLSLHIVPSYRKTFYTRSIISLLARKEETSLGPEIKLLSWNIQKLTALGMSSRSPSNSFYLAKKIHAKTNQHLNLNGKYGRACSYWMDLLTLLHTGKYVSWVCTSSEQHSVRPKFVVLHRGGIIQWWLHPSASAEFHFRP